MPRIPTIIKAQPVGPAKNSQLRGPAHVFQQTPDRQVNDLQRQMSEATSQAKALPFGDGNMVKDVSLPASGIVTVDHKLGRPYQGYHLLHVRTGPASGVVAVPDQPHPEIQIVLGNLATAPTLVDVWVY